MSQIRPEQKQLTTSPTSRIIWSLVGSHKTGCAGHAQRSGVALPCLPAQLFFSFVQLNFSSSTDRFANAGHLCEFLSKGPAQEIETETEP